MLLSPPRPRWKHPHACGEDRRRGKGWCVKYGNTPTRVGKTEKTAVESVLEEETPPRVWGRPVQDAIRRAARGNTPTRVGKTPRHHDHAAHRWKHPHACGEDIDDVAYYRPQVETPPRVWGRPARAGSPTTIWGNTPTRVGKTTTTTTETKLPEKHPHACGEDSAPISTPSAFTETPPRVWGRQVACGSPRERCGNTPTRVGKTAFHHLRDGRVQETPPRVWGRRCATTAPQPQVRNTPTRVGKTRVHPCTSGHHEETPPRVWGRLRVPGMEVSR